MRSYAWLNPLQGRVRSHKHLMPSPSRCTNRALTFSFFHAIFPASSKHVRGNRTKAQKQRKLKLLGKAMARSDRTAALVYSKQAKQHKKHALKHIY